MDLDQMKVQWAQYDRKLEESLRLNLRILSAVHLKEARSRLRRLLVFTSVEAAAWFVLIAALGSFIYRHASHPQCVLAAGALDVYAIGLLAALIRQIVIAGRIDYGRPVIAIQKQLQAVRVLRIRTTQWAVLGGIVVWALVPMVVFQAFAGQHAGRISGGRWLIANVVFGLALIALSIRVSKKYGDRIARSPIIRRLLNDIAGRDLNAAANVLMELSEFERQQT